MKRRLFQGRLLIFLIASLISCQTKEAFILNENFDENKLGWIEESTEFHQVRLDSGFYYLSSIDTTASTFVSSTGSLDKSYLLGLPDAYDICTSIKLIKSRHDDASYGIFLYGASVQYSFRIYKSGKIEVTEYDYNADKEYILLSADSELEFEGEVYCRIAINNTSFKFFIEDFEIGESEFCVKSWQELRLFTSRETAISIDYLRIKKTTQQEPV